MPHIHLSTLSSSSLVALPLLLALSACSSDDAQPSGTPTGTGQVDPGAASNAGGANALPGTGMPGSAGNSSEAPDNGGSASPGTGGTDTAGGSPGNGSSETVGGSNGTPVSTPDLPAPPGAPAAGNGSQGGAAPTAGANSGAAAATGGSAGMEAMAGATNAAGASNAAGATNAAGASNAAGAPGFVDDGQCPDPNDVKWTGSDKRPQLTEESAACFTIPKYFKDWNPTANPLDAASFTPTLTVAADGTGTHTSVQEAVKAATGTARVYILLKPGTYRETVCVEGPTPITIYGTGADPSAVAISYDNQNGKSVGGTLYNECVPPGTPYPFDVPADNPSGSYGTTTSSTVFIRSDNFQAVNLTIDNENKSKQAVAMTTHGDKLIFQNVQFHGGQDTLQPGSPNHMAKARSYYKDCFVDGDTDFVFGNGTAVFDNCEIHHLGGGAMAAPSTDKRVDYGFLMINSRLTGKSGKLARAWNNSTNFEFAKGSLVIRDSVIGGHIPTDEPYSPSTGGSPRSPFSPENNRFWEYNNTGDGAAN